METKMGVSILAVAVLLALPVVTLCYTDQWLHQIYVDKETQHGVDDPSCWTGGHSTPCRSLNLALTGAQHYNHSTAIFLQPGKHQLHGGSETQLRDMSQLAIVGNNSKGEVVIICEPLAGLAFSWSKNIEIKNIDFVGCGVQINISMNIPTQYATSLEIQIALYFSSCEGICLTNVCVYESTGTGVAIYNPVGVVNIDKCQFIRNGLTLSELGGGGLVIEANERTPGSFCTISDTSFTQNTASSGHYSHLSNPYAYFGPGREGGGILIVFRGGAVNNTVQLENITFERNTAQFGGGIFLGFYENASGNVVNINNGQITQNMALLESKNFLSSAKGGGAFIGLVSSESEGVFNNTVTINNTRFDSNEAQMGGGISVHVLYDTQGCSSTGGNKLLISNCIFSNNQAFQGASAYLSQSSDGICGSQALDATLHHSSFTGGHCVVSLMNGFGLPCRGDVLMLSFTLMVQDVVMFNGARNLSALHLQYSSLKLLPFTKLEFHNNSAENGAAIYLVDCSLILVNYNTNLLFQNNSVSNRGGAIYAETCKLHVDQANGKGCFIRHVNSTLHPNQWATEIGFNENKAVDEGNAIYVDSTKPCIWTDSSSNTNKDTFCWNGWSFEKKPNCNRSQLTSGPASITGPKSYTVQPGDCFNLSDYELFDSWNNSIQSNFDVKILSGTALSRIIKRSSCTIFVDYWGRTSTYRSDTCYALLSDCSEDYNNKNSVLLVHPPQFPGILVNISFELCKTGSICSNGRCESCKYTSAYSTVCNKTHLELLGCISYYDDTVCDVFSKREGMCGNCDDPSFGVVFNFPFFICAKCEWYGHLVFFEFMLILLMMTILSVLHINITSGSMNGYILYSQLVSLDLPGLGSTAWVPSTINTTYFLNMKQLPTSVPLTVYSMWNLNFLTLVPVPLCIREFSVVGVILLEYVVAVCPLLFTLVTYVWIQWYNNGYRFVVYTTRPVHQLLARFWQKYKIQPTLIDTYAGLMLLAYMRILTVSTKIFITFGLQIKENTLDEWITVLVVLATLSILLFVVPMMVILLFYHLKTFQRCLTCFKLDRPGLHALVDVYQGCFLNIATDGSEKRFFAGIYFSFRFFYIIATALVVVIFNKFGVPLLPSDFPITFALVAMFIAFIMAGMVLILRPYKKVVHNVIDFMVFLFMCPIPYLCVFNEDIFRIDHLINIIFLPFLIFTFVILCKLLKYCCTKRSVACNCQSLPDDERNPPVECTPLVTTAPTTKEVTLDDDYIEDSFYADRIVNPRGYNEEHNQFYGSIRESQPSPSVIAQFQAPALNNSAGDAKPPPNTV